MIPSIFSKLDKFPYPIKPNVPEWFDPNLEEDEDG